MIFPPGSALRRGFSLVEVLVALALCALLASAVSSAVAFSARAERFADRDGDASLLVASLCAAQRLRPDDLPSVPPGWRVDRSSEIVRLADGSLREWHLLSVSAPGGESPSFVLRIFEDSP